MYYNPHLKHLHDTPVGKTQVTHGKNPKIQLCEPWDLLLYLLDDDDDDDHDGMLPSPALFSLHAKIGFCHFSSPSHLFYILPIFFGEPLKLTAHPAARSCYTCQLDMSNHPALLLLMTSL